VIYEPYSDISSFQRFYISMDRKGKLPFLTTVNVERRNEQKTNKGKDLVKERKLE
jgi:DNA/RNA endonuclease G (NUC1)